MSVIHNDLLLSTDEATGYNLTNSLRFRSSASAYLSRTPTSAGNQKTWTWSGWVKRGTLGAEQSFVSCYVDGNNQAKIAFNSSDSIDFYNQNAGSITARFITTAVFRDSAAWYHIVVRLDASTGVGGIYVNGVAQTLSTNTNTNANTYFNSTNAHNIGRFGNATQYFDGCLTEVNFVDGQALTPSSFGEFNADTGVWQPIAYSGTYGTNGFYLPFTDVATTSGSNAGLGKDFSGNGNYWNTNNISVTAGSTYDSMTDVPTLTSETAANYAVLNPLNKNGAAALSNGNLTVYTASNDVCYTASTIAMTAGNKYYFELTCQTATASGFYQAVGIWSAEQFKSYDSGVYTQYYSYDARATFYNGSSGSGSYGATWTNGDVIGVAVDMTAGSMVFYKNGVSQGTATTSINTALSYYATVFTYTTQASLNFGQRPFAYTPPTGFVALNTYNLPDSTIVAGNTVMDVVTRNGFGASGGIITSLNFKPDFVWEKSRNNAYNHQLVDSVRGLTKYLNSNLTDAENTQTNYFTALNSNGYTLGSNDYGTSVTLVDWVWQAGQGTTSSNTDGSITSTVSVNANAGFSVVTWTGTGSGAATVGHGLNVAPKFIITKPRGITADWICYNENLGNNAYLVLNSTAAQVTGATTVWGSTSPTSSVFSLGSGYNYNTTMVAYCWAEIAGFSKFGSYTGNGSTDGTFVYTGFRPKYILIKRTDNVSDWWLLDSSRDSYNVVAQSMYANSSAAEFTETDLDFLSNGFKLRKTASPNSSGGTFIYAAFAENPFKNSLAR